MSDQAELLVQAKEYVETYIRPMILGDGGDIEVAGMTPENFLQLKIQGNCVHCASLPMTLTLGIESRIKEAFPDIKGVIQIQE